MIRWVIGVTSAILFILWFLWELKHAPVEDFDRDLAARETDEVAESVRGQLEQLRKGGAL
jgi:hypothetical protein